MFELPDSAQSFYARYAPYLEGAGRYHHGDSRKIATAFVEDLESLLQEQWQAWCSVYGKVAGEYQRGSGV